MSRQLDRSSMFLLKNIGPKPNTVQWIVHFPLEAITIEEKLLTG